MVHALAQQLLRSGEIWRARLRGCPSRALSPTQPDRQTEIDDAYVPRRLVDQDVLGLEVSVDEPEGVSVLERGNRLLQHVDDALRRERAFGLYGPSQVSPSNILHRVPQQATALPDVVGVGDVRMDQLGRHARLATEPLHHLRIDHEVRVQHLEGHLTLERQIPDPIHPPEPADTELLEQFVFVTQRTTEPFLPTLRVVRLDVFRGQGGLHGELAEIGHQVPHHLDGREETVGRMSPQATHDDALQCHRTRLADGTRIDDALRLRIRSGPRHGAVQDRGGAVHIA